MNINIKEHLNQKIIHQCLKLYENEHYVECVHSAMKQVEISLNKKLGIDSYMPISKTIREKFSKGKGVRLKVPFGDEQQESAKLLFQGAFKYYRNHAAHQDKNISNITAFRVMFIASELLDLLDVCRLNIEEIGGIEELKKILQLEDNAKFLELLTLIDGQWIIDNGCDGFFEDLYKSGFNEYQYQNLFKLDLVSYECGPCESLEKDCNEPEEICFFRLTELGKEAVAILKSTMV